MRLSLNGWQRLGVVLSVVWMVAAPLYWTDREHKSADEDALSMYRLCRADPFPADVDKCTKLSDDVPQRHQRFDNHLPGNAVLAAFLLALAWIAALIAVAVGKWIVKGLKSQQTL